MKRDFLGTRTQQNHKTQNTQFPPRACVRCGCRAGPQMMPLHCSADSFVAFGGGGPRPDMHRTAHRVSRNRNKHTHTHKHLLTKGIEDVQTPPSSPPKYGDVNIENVMTPLPLNWVWRTCQHHPKPFCRARRTWQGWDSTRLNHHMHRRILA
jgi:hypothetical protein